MGVPHNSFWVLQTDPDHILSTPYFLVSPDIPGLILPLPQPVISYFPQGAPGHHYFRMVYKDQDPGTRSAHCSWGATTSRHN